MESIDGISETNLAKNYIAKFKKDMGHSLDWHPMNILKKFNYRRTYSAWPAKQKKLIGELNFSKSLIPGNYNIDEATNKYDSLFRRTLGRFSKRTSNYVLT